MSIPKACIEAALQFVLLQDYPEKCARRVILALAENLPESAVEKARSTFRGAIKTVSPDEAIDAAIAAFLKDVAGETP